MPPQLGYAVGDQEGPDLLTDRACPFGRGFLLVGSSAASIEGPSGPDLENYQGRVCVSVMDRPTSGTLPRSYLLRPLTQGFVSAQFTL